METETLVQKEKATEPITQLLNEYLATYQVHYQKLRGCHWNVTGSSFFTLHIKFEELYTHAQQTIDELAERLLSLKTTPLSTLKDYLDKSRIKEVKTQGISDIILTKAILDDLRILIDLERKILRETALAGDDGTNDMVNGFMQFKEKNSWMLEAFCK